jgi:membrane protein YqaA with SNARE-associated domain
LKNFIKSKLFLNIVRGLVLIGVIALTIYLYSLKDELKNLQVYSYAGIFIVSIIANATIIIPLPGIVLTSMMGTIFNPLGVALAAGSGAALGELTGYLAGFSGQGVVENSERYHRLTEWMVNHTRLSNIAILLVAFIPNPFFDLAGMASGALRIPVWRFLFFVWIGKLMKMLLFAYAGAWLIKLFPNF